MTEDAELVRAIAAGGEEGRSAEARFVRRFEGRVRVFARRHMRDATLVDDMAQHVLATTIASARRGAIDEPERLAGFVLATCRRTLFTHFSGERRREAALRRLEPAVHLDPPPPLDRARLRHCLAQLGERERQVVMLTYFADLDGDEIARELAVSIANVRVMRHRAMGQLAACMGVEDR